MKSPPAALTEFHPRDTRLVGGTDTEAAHAAVVEIERAVREQVQEEAVVLGSVGIGDVLAEVAVAGDAVGVETVLCAEPWMGERAVKTSAGSQPAAQTLQNGDARYS